MRKRFVRLTMALGAMVVALGYQQSQRPEKPKPAAAPATGRSAGTVSFHEQLLATLPEGMSLKDVDKNIVFSPAGTRVAYEWSEKKGASRLVIGDVTGPELGVVGLPWFSEDGKRFAYWAKQGEKKAERALLLVEGEDPRTFDDVGNPLVSNSPGRLACAVKDGSRAFVLSDGKRADSHDFDRINQLTLDASGSRLAYVGTRGKEEFAVIGDQISGPFEEVSWQNTPFSPDGRRIGFSAKKNRTGFFVLDGVEGPGMEQTAGPFFSQNGRHVAYLGVQGGKSFLVVDGARKPAYDSVSWGTSPFSPNGLRVAYVATRGARNIAVVDDKPGEEFDGVSSPVFSPDSKTVAYVARLGEEMFVVVNGKRGASYKEIWWGGPTFSPDSRRLAFIAKMGQKWQVVVDGHGGKTFDGIFPHRYFYQAFQLTLSFPHCLVFSPDSLHLAYVGVDRDKVYVMLDERASGPYDGVGGALLSGHGTGATVKGDFVMAGRAEFLVGGGDTVDRRVLVFSADSSRLAFGAREGRALWWRVIDVKSNAPRNVLQSSSLPG